MNANLVGAVGAGGFFLLLIVIVWQLAATWRARALAARDEQYRQLVRGSFAPGIRAPYGVRGPRSYYDLPPWGVRGPAASTAPRVPRLC